MNFTLIFVCLVLLVLGRIGHGALDLVRESFLDLTAPVLEAASVPAIAARHGATRVASYLGSFSEIDRLRDENAKLRQWEWRAKLAERKVAQLRGLLNAADEPALHFATGNVIADGRGPFLQSALVNLGRDQGIRVGYAVIDGDGLVGRTIEAGAAFSRVLLLSDRNSHVPVLAGKPGVRGIASGEGAAELALEFLPDGAVLHEGEEVFTSGSDGVLPRGLRVGVVTGSPGAYKVRPHADLGALDVVSVLYFDTPELVRTDPPAVASDRALSGSPGSTAPDTVPTASIAEPAKTSAIEPAPPAASGANVAQTQQ